MLCCEVCGLWRDASANTNCDNVVLCEFEDQNKSQKFLLFFLEDKNQALCRMTSTCISPIRVRSWFSRPIEVFPNTQSGAL